MRTIRQLATITFLMLLQSTVGNTQEIIGTEYDTVTFSAGDGSKVLPQPKFVRSPLKTKRVGKLVGFCEGEACEEVAYIYRNILWEPEARGYVASDTMGNKVLLDDKGNVLVKRPTKTFRTWNSHFFAEKREGQAGIYDLKTRRWVITPDKLYASTMYVDKNQLVYGILDEETGEKINVTTDLTGKKVEDKKQFDTYQSFPKQNAVIATRGDSTFIIDKAGNIKFDLTGYDRIQKYNEMILLQKDGKYGLIHPETLAIFPCVVDKFTSLSITGKEFRAQIDGEEKHVVFREEKFVEVEE